MTHVVTESCIKCKHTDCVDVCPVDCFNGHAPRQMRSRVPARRTARTFPPDLSAGPLRARPRRRGPWSTSTRTSSQQPILPGLPTPTRRSRAMPLGRATRSCGAASRAAGLPSFPSRHEASGWAAERESSGRCRRVPVCGGAIGSVWARPGLWGRDRVGVGASRSAGVDRLVWACPGWCPDHLGHSTIPLPSCACPVPSLRCTATWSAS